MGAMRPERWARLLANPAIHEKASQIAHHATRELVAAMELRELLRREGSVDANAAERELEEACEMLEHNLAYAMNRLPSTKRREIANELEGASASASLKKAVS